MYFDMVLRKVLTIRFPIDAYDRQLTNIAVVRDDEKVMKLLRIYYQ